MIEKMLKGKLNKATIVTYQCRGETHTVAMGYVTGHYKFPDNTPIRTSNVVDIDPEKELVHTLNSVYELESLATDEEHQELVNTFCLFFRNKEIIAVVKGQVT